MICVTCAMGSMQAEAGWFGTTELIAGNRFIQTPYGFIKIASLLKKAGKFDKHS